MTDVGTVTMSAKELDRLEVLGRVIERRLTQRQAAEQLGLRVLHRALDATPFPYRQLTAERAG
jgi:hypothetical protein